MGTHPLSLQEHCRKAGSRWCICCTWVSSYCHSRQEFLFVHPPQVRLAQGSDQTRALAPTPATSPIAGQVNGQRKELQYTQKQSSATTKCGQLNKGCCLPVFIRILASNNQQDPPGGISIYFGVCRVFAQTLLFHHSCLYLGADPGYSLGLARSKLSHTDNTASQTLSPSRYSCHRGQDSKWEDHSISAFAKRIWDGRKAKYPMHKQKSSLQPYICHVFGITWSAQHKHSPAKLNCGIALQAHGTSFLYAPTGSHSLTSVRLALNSEAVENRDCTP